MILYLQRARESELRVFVSDYRHEILAWLFSGFLVLLLSRIYSFIILYPSLYWLWMIWKLIRGVATHMLCIWKSSSVGVEKLGRGVEIARAVPGEGEGEKYTWWYLNILIYSKGSLLFKLFLINFSKICYMKRYFVCREF